MSDSDSTDVQLAHRLWEEGRQRRSSGDYSRAIACLTTALALDKTNARIWTDIARVWLELGSIEDAWYAITTALRYDSDSEEAKTIFKLLQKGMD
ncbi:MAG: tetratricopeptide repeat protein [Candidatus Thorarchaeota archaeon]|jgi:Flp pilus assembly protein TadD